MAKVMISLPDELLARIDSEAARRGTTRSALLREGVKRILLRDREAIDAAIERLRGAFAEAGSFDSAAEIRTERDERDRRDASRL